MTRKYGDLYRCVKKVYPDAYKLPEDEIKPMTRIARTQGNTIEETQNYLNNYVKNNQQKWKQTYFGNTRSNSRPQPAQPKPYLSFNGQELSWIENGIKKKSWKGMSGKPDFQCSKYQNQTNKGPLPSGTYQVKKIIYNI